MASETEFESASSSLSSPSSEEMESNEVKKIEGNNSRNMVLEQGKGMHKDFKSKAFERLFLDNGNVEENCFVLESGNKSNQGGSDEEQIDIDSGVPITMDSTKNGKALRFTLPAKTAKMLYPHQREGLKWLRSLHCRGTGGILGDDMGLGKTMQISAFLTGLFHSKLVNRVLVVAPKTLLGHWIKELSTVGLSSKIREYSGTKILFSF